MAEAAVTALLGGATSAAASYLGAQTTAKAAKEAAALQQKRYEQAVSYQQPYLTAGTNALTLYNDATGATGSDAQKAYYESFQTDPGFTASVNYGLSKIEASAAASGMGLSGNTLAALQDYSQTSLSNAYQTRLNNLYKTATLGASAANALTSAATSSASSTSSTLLAAASSEASALTSAVNSLTGSAKSLASYYYGS
ncbi:hypothetical protein KKP04_08660 [Rhodomicrobium sp. Az07]|uniref:hypothetical protein n=1 Tax=Rhodomicrobium sp. Az07 TaxID=2839034 RepID=UPI001BE86D35|nr:hypothetical protein [Rhodomicrobium sp. Az07]MBT3070937.1 hypothetical protein [Rhodomicrobium sp. Az07]